MGIIPDPAKSTILGLNPVLEQRITCREPISVTIDNLPTNRKFRLWEYRASHSLLVIRSRRPNEGGKNIDLFFIDVAYLASPTFLDEITLDGPTNEEIQAVEAAIGQPLNPQQSVYILVAGDRRFTVAALTVRVEENEDDGWLESPISRHLGLN